MNHETKTPVTESVIVLHYFRCTDCLTPFAMPINYVRPVGTSWLSYKRNPKLPAGVMCECGNVDPANFEHMGHVTNDAWHKVEVDHECACNELCVVARGPKCNCACGGKNHGQGMTPVSRVTESGVVSAVSVTPAAKALGALVRAARADRASGALYGVYSGFASDYQWGGARRNALLWSVSSIMERIDRAFYEMLDARTDKKRRELLNKIGELSHLSDSSGMVRK